MPISELDYPLSTPTAGGRRPDVLTAAIALCRLWSNHPDADHVTISADLDGDGRFHVRAYRAGERLH